MGLGQEAADLVERCQPGALRLEIARLVHDLGLQTLIERPQPVSHVVEAGCDIAEFVIRPVVDPHLEIPLLDPLQPLAQPLQRDGSRTGNPRRA